MLWSGWGGLGLCWYSNGGGSFMVVGWRSVVEGQSEASVPTVALVLSPGPHRPTSEPGPQLSPEPMLCSVPAMRPRVPLWVDSRA